MQHPRWVSVLPVLLCLGLIFPRAAEAVPMMHCDALIKLANEQQLWINSSHLSGNHLQTKWGPCCPRSAFTSPGTNRVTSEHQGCYISQGEGATLLGAGTSQGVHPATDGHSRESIYWHPAASRLASPSCKKTCLVFGVLEKIVSGWHHSLDKPGSSCWLST